MREKRNKKGSGAIMAVIAVYLLLPLVLTFIYSLFTQWINILPGGFSLKAYAELFGDSYFWTSILRTVVISIVPVVICTILVLLAMYAVVVYMPGLGGVMKTLCTIPYAIQGVILPISILGLYSAAPEPFSNRVFMLVSAYCIVVLPYIYQGVRNSLNSVHAPELLDAAQMLGARRFYAFWTIILPNIAGGIIVSSMLSLAVVFGDFVIVNTLAGNYYPTGQMYLYAAMKESGQKASAVIVILFVVTLLISMTVLHFQRDKKGGKS